MQVRHAVINGPKFAYPKGVRLKYAKVCLIVFSGVAKLQTAPEGSNSRITETTAVINNMILCFFIFIAPF